MIWVGVKMRKIINIRLITIGIVLLSLLVISTGIALSQDLPPGVPTPEPIDTGGNGGGGNGGGGNGGGYSAPPADVFPKAFNILNSNGIVIGNVTAYSYSDIRAHAEYNISTLNGIEWVYVDANIGSIPTSEYRMDIGLDTPDASLLPDFIHPEMMIAQVDFTKCSGWNIKDGSFKVTIKVPKATLNGVGSNDSYYFLQTDSDSVLKANIAGPDSDGMMTFDATAFHVSLSSTNTVPFMLLAVSKALPTPVPTPTPTPVATTPTPTPSSGSGISTFMLLLMVFIPAVIAGLIIVYYEMLRKGK